MFRSGLRELFRFLASLQLAMILLGVIVIASIAGTLCESRFNADVAREYIYDARWFNIWLGVLCINLFCVAASRYPWKPHHTGFVITHAGIITLLIGAMIDRNFGVEGYLHLNRGEDGTSTMELHTQELRVYVKGSEEYGAVTFRTKAMTSQAKRTFAARSPADNVKVQVMDINAVQEVKELEEGEKGKPALQFTLRSAAMGQNTISLFLGDEQDMGRATVRFSKGMPPVIAASATGKTASPAEGGMVPRRERFYVFAKHSEPMAHTLAGDPTGADAKLFVDPAGKIPARLQLKLMEKDFSIDVADAAKREISIEGLPDWKLSLTGFYPNFRFDSGQPGTIDDKLENPAVLFELKGPLVKAGAPSQSPHGAMGHGSNETNVLSFFLGDDGKIRYHNMSKKGESAGEVVMDRPIPLGWGPGFEFVAERFIEKAIRKVAWRPKPGDFDPEMPGAGLLCRVESGGVTKDVWVGKCRADEMRTASVEVHGKNVELAFCNSTYELPFSVSLLKFEAPRNEGMDNSTSFMEFKSTLAFDGAIDIVQLKRNSKSAQKLKSTELDGAILEVSADALRLQQPMPAAEPVEIPMEDIEGYDKQSHVISMNRPTTYPVSAIAPWLGTNYKFSQANHDFPRNPDYSGVQVLRNPGWMPEWLGSLMICFGIFTMFYLKPYFRRKPDKQIVKEKR